MTNFPTAKASLERSVANPIEQVVPIAGFAEGLDVPIASFPSSFSGNRSSEPLIETGSSSVQVREACAKGCG